MRESLARTRGHMAFEDPQGGLLFTGDHIVPRITPPIAFERVPEELALRSHRGHDDLSQPNRSSACRGTYTVQPIVPGIWSNGCRAYEGACDGRFRGSPD